MSTKRHTGQNAHRTKERERERGRWSVGKSGKEKGYSTIEWGINNKNSARAAQNCQCTKTAINVRPTRQYPLVYYIPVSLSLSLAFILFHINAIVSVGMAKISISFLVFLLF